MVAGKFPSFRSRHPTPTPEPKPVVLPPAIARREAKAAQTVQVRSNVVAAARRTGGCCGGAAKRTARTPATKSLLSRAAQYAAAMARHIADDGAATSPADLAFRQACCEACPHNVADVCVLCDCPLKKNALNNGKLAWRSETCPAGRWFRQTAASQPLVNPIRNLIFHVYPLIGREWNWHRHVQHIRDNADVWNGKRIVSIMTGAGMTPPDIVQRQFDGVRIDKWIVLENTKTVGETAPFIPSLREVQSLDPNEVTMYAHTKGITHTETSKEQIWSEMMWDVCLNLMSVDNALASHAMAGVFKRHMRLLTSQWHYSGAFWWLRHKDVFSNPRWQTIVQQRAGMEAWPGTVCKNDRAACLFHDDPPLSFLADNYWRNEVVPEFERWKSARNMP